MKEITSTFLCLTLVILGCVGGREASRTGTEVDAKIHLDLAILDADGLHGPPGGRRALDYEFCIPATSACERAVLEIDKSVRLQRGAPGRIGCGPDQILCIGNTHRKDYRTVLRRLAGLPYVTRIQECSFE